MGLGTAASGGQQACAGSTGDGEPEKAFPQKVLEMRTVAVLPFPPAKPLWVLVQAGVADGDLSSSCLLALAHRPRHSVLSSRSGRKGQRLGGPAKPGYPWGLVAGFTLSGTQCTEEGAG